MAPCLSLWRTVFSGIRNGRRAFSFPAQVGRNSMHTNFAKSRRDANNSHSNTNKTFTDSNYKIIPVALVGAVTGYVIGAHLQKKMWHQGDCEAQNQTGTVKNDSLEENKSLSLDETVAVCRDKVQRIKDEFGAPGIVVAVSVDGKLVWSEGLGYSDVENRVQCHAGTVLRIASISKSITSVIVGKLVEENKIDLDKSIREYVKPEVWPDKSFKGDQVTITLRQLMAHLGGVRHYNKNCKKAKKVEKAKDEVKDKKESLNPNEKEMMANSNVQEVPEMKQKEYYIRDRYKSVADALKIFKDDELCSKPGSQYMYTTYGYTLVSAVVEGASGKKFPVLMRALFRELGMNQSYLDENEPIIYNRSRYYVKSTNGKLLNAPYVDCSNKWAGGGILSSAGDLVKFGNVMLYCYQHDPARGKKPGYLRRETVEKLWEPVPIAKCDWDTDGAYGLGWGIVKAGQKHGGCKTRRFYASHTGGAIGASSALVVLPKQTPGVDSRNPPQGVVVAIITNMQSVGMNKVALEIAKLFEEIRKS